MDAPHPSANRALRDAQSFSCCDLATKKPNHVSEYSFHRLIAK